MDIFQEKNKELIIELLIFNLSDFWIYSKIYILNKNFYRMINNENIIKKFKQINIYTLHVPESNTTEYYNAYPNGYREQSFSKFCDGKLIETGVYVKNKIEGVVTSYFPEGEPNKIKSYHTYQNGILNGEYVTYHPNGNKQEEGMYLNGLLHGQIRYFYSSGNLLRIIYYNNGMKDGLAVAYTNDTLINKLYKIIYKNDMMMNKKTYDVPH